jgi:hypothetical protein
MRCYNRTYDATELEESEAVAFAFLDFDCRYSSRMRATSRDADAPSDETTARNHSGGDESTPVPHADRSAGDSDR